MQACADKLKQELEDYGDPPQFPVEEAIDEATAVCSPINNERVWADYFNKGATKTVNLCEQIISTGGQRKQ